MTKTIEELGITVGSADTILAKSKDVLVGGLNDRLVALSKTGEETSPSVGSTDTVLLAKLNDVLNALIEKEAGVEIKVRARDTAMLLEIGDVPVVELRDASIALIVSEEYELGNVIVSTDKLLAVLEKVLMLGLKDVLVVALVEKLEYGPVEFENVTFRLPET